MAHPEQREFITELRNKHPQEFEWRYIDIRYRGDSNDLQIFAVKR